MRDYDRDPLVAIWEVTRACRLACVHCRAEAIPRRNPRELTTAEGRNLIDQIASFDRPPVFVITGGDPMERPDLLELARHAVGRGLKTALSPSATDKVTYDRLAALREAGLHRVALSLDGDDPVSHDRFRGVPGSFQRTLEIASDLRRLGLPLQVGTTITRFNVDRLAELAARVQEMGTLMWSVFFLVPTGRAGTDMAVSPEEAERFLNDLHALSRRVRFAIKTTEAPMYRRIAAQRAGNAAPERDGVADGRGFVFISHTGEVCPSGFLPLTAGNVRGAALTAIYRDSPLFRSLRRPDGFKGRCGRCEFRRICGGSRARAYAATGDPLASDPLCPYLPPEIPAGRPDTEREYSPTLQNRPTLH